MSNTFFLDPVAAHRLKNLAWACPGCNLHKAGGVEFADPESGRLVALFNPRSDRWTGHFCWLAFEVMPLTAIGRATCEALSLNQSRRVLIRQAEAMFSLFPPDVSDM